MKFLVLGASSFYGSNFCALLRERGEDVQPIDRHDFDFDSKPYRVAYHAREWKADIIVNFISRSLVAESWERPEDWVYTNSFAFVQMLEALRKETFGRFIHVSTPEVYGHNAAAVREGHAFNPSTPYAVSRAAADMMIAAYVKAYQFPAIITRTANIYGLGQPDYRFIPHAFKTLRAGQKLQLDGGGNTVRGWLHVRDACEATYLLCKEGLLGETYHIAPRVIMNTLGIAQMICAQLRLDSREVLEDRPDRLGKDVAYIMDSAKLRKLGWSERIQLKEGLAEYGNNSVVS